MYQHQFKGMEECKESHVWFSNFDPRDEWKFSWLTSIRYDSLDGTAGNLVKMKLTQDSGSQSTISQASFLEEEQTRDGNCVCDSSSSFRLVRWWDLLWVFSMIISHWAERSCAVMRAQPAGVTHTITGVTNAMFPQEGVQILCKVVGGRVAALRSQV